MEITSFILPVGLIVAAVGVTAALVSFSRLALLRRDVKGGALKPFMSRLRRQPKRNLWFE